MVLAACGVRRFEIGFGWFFTLGSDQIKELTRKKLMSEWLGIDGACDTVV